MKCILPFLAAVATGLAATSCRHAPSTEGAPRAIVIGMTKPPQEEISAPTATPEPTSQTTPLRLRDPDLLSDLPDDRQFQPTSPGFSATNRDGTVIASPPPKNDR